MKNKDTLKRNVFAFLIPILILLISLGINKFYPFGNKLLTMLDGYNQYPGFLNSFIESLKSHQMVLSRQMMFLNTKFIGEWEWVIEQMRFF